MPFFAPRLKARPDLVHSFTGKGGPDCLLDLRVGGDPAAWRRLSRAMGMPGAPVAYASQVHGARVLTAYEGGLVGEADALISRTPGLLLAIRVADCVPILLARDGVVAAVHAGWRGLVAGVIPAAIEAMGGADVAAVGPCISVAKYEVGPEVIDSLLATGVPARVFVKPGKTGTHVDLRAVAAWQIRAGGCAKVDVLGTCTFRSERLWSYRQEGAEAGRQAGVIGLR